MELVSWSLNAVDQIFSTRRAGKGEPACPSGTYPAGYAIDSWDKWRIVCLSIMSIEDVEDAYIIGLMITGFLLFGFCSFLIYPKVKKAMAAVLALEKLPVMTEGLGRAINTQTQAICESNRKLDAMMELLRKVGDNLEKLKVRLG